MYIVIGTSRSGSNNFSEYVYGPFQNEGEALSAVQDLFRHPMNRNGSGYKFDFQAKQVVAPPFASL